MTDQTVTDNPARSRYELAVAGDVAVLEYRLLGEKILALIHTDVPDGLQGQGVGRRLVVHALEDARARSITILPLCPFVAAYLRRHPTYRNLVSSRYKGFDLH